MRKTPYTATVGYAARRGPSKAARAIGASSPTRSIRLSPRRSQSGMAAQKGKSAGDPWCIGYFVDNEISWGDDPSLAIAALASPADQPAKIAFVGDLKAKYGTIDKLNAAWGTQHASWDALLKSTTPPDKQKAGDDLPAFYTRIAEKYFRGLPRRGQGSRARAALPRLPLCLGRTRGRSAPRPSTATWSASTATATRCADFELPEGCDKPVMIGEFHFGALDRGMFHTGLVPTASQDERARALQALCPQRAGQPVIRRHPLVPVRRPGDHRPAATARTTRSACSTSATRRTPRPSAPSAKSGRKCIVAAQRSETKTEDVRRLHRLTQRGRFV